MQPFVLPKSECIILRLPYFTIFSILLSAIFQYVILYSTAFYYMILWPLQKGLRSCMGGQMNHEAIVLNPKAPLLNFSACVAGQRRTSDAPLD